MSVRGNVNFEIANTYKVTNLKAGTVAGDAVEYAQMNTAISAYHDASKYDATVPLQSITLATADINANNHKITNVLNPTLAQDAATKNYVDTKIVAGTALEIWQSYTTTVQASSQR